MEIMKTKTLLIIIVTFCSISLYSQNNSTTGSLSDIRLSQLEDTGQPHQTSNASIDKKGALSTDGLIGFSDVGIDPTGELIPGPCFFELDDPGNITSLGSGVPVDFLSGGTWANGKWYGTQWGVGDLYEINPYDGSLTFIGSNGYNLSGLAWDGLTMYCCSGEFFGSIDPETGAATIIGPMGNTDYMISIACDNEGNVYGIDDTDDNLYSINRTTGAATIIGPLGININNAQDLAYDKGNDVLYLAGYASPNGALYTIDVTTGTATLVGNFMNNAHLVAFAIPYDDPIYSDDIGIDIIIQPSSGVFLTNAEPVVVQIRNFGMNDQSDFDVSFIVNDGSLVIETITDTIPRGQTYEYTFTATADLSADGDYTIEVCTNMDGDYNPDNDCQTKMVVNGLIEFCEATTNIENEWISKVICGSISQESDWQGGVADYTDYKNTIAPGGSEAIYIINGLPYPGDYVSVWVDWNNDTTFQIDTEEEIYLINDDGANEVFYGNIEAPFGIAEGNYRMRVRLARNDDPNPCGPEEYGEVEDYTIVVDSVYTGIEPADHLVKIQVYPNPASDMVNIKSDNLLKFVTMFNQTGQKVFDMELNSSFYRLSASGFTPGIYLLRIETDKGFIFKRTIIN